MAKESIHETEQLESEQWLNLEQMKIAKWLKKLRFRSKLFGGVNEQDVWKKIAELNAMYESALTAERVRYDALIKDHKNEHSSRATDIEEFNVDSATIISDNGEESQMSTWNRGKVSNE